jgi:hypothetical protein
MPLHVTCPDCGRQFQVPDGQIKPAMTSLTPSPPAWATKLVVPNFLVVPATQPRGYLHRLLRVAILAGFVAVGGIIGEMWPASKTLTYFGTAGFLVLLMLPFVLACPVPSGGREAGEPTMKSGEP